ncbi:hypothetical protein IV102_01415 [bacterium]|nr:hypothetical protein [bacterium]
MNLWIPDLIWSSELLSISDETKAQIASAFQVVELDGDQVGHAQDLMSADLRLSFADCSALADFGAEAFGGAGGGKAGQFDRLGLTDFVLKVSEDEGAFLLFHQFHEAA